MPLAPDIVAGVSRRLVEHAGLELPAWVVEARALARISALAVTPEAYVELIATARGAAELRELVEAVRVGESSLFRHRSQIAALTDVVVPALRDRGRRTVRVWSAGCASGEEPYTLAIILSRALPGHTISIIATDVSDDALEAAQRATYPSAELVDVPDEYRDAIIEDGDRVRVRPEIAQLVRFERANLVDAAPPRHCDVVWCRNVLIYFSVAARRRAIERLVAATVPGGFVFVGYSESLREITELEAQRAGDAVFYVKRGDWTAADRTPVPEMIQREQTSPGLAIPARAATSGPAPRTGTNPAVATSRREGTDPGITPPRRDSGLAASRTGTQVGAAPLRATIDGFAAARTGTQVGVAPLRSSEAALAVPRTSTRAGVAPERTGTSPAVPRTANSAADARAHRTPVGGVPAVDPAARHPQAASSADPRAHRTSPSGVPALVPAERRTPPSGLPVVESPARPSTIAGAAHETVLALTGAPDAAEVTNLLGDKLAISGLRRLTIDLDSAVMLEDDLAPVIRRACAAARGAGVEIVICATRTGSKRWVSRHGLEDIST